MVTYTYTGNYTNIESQEPLSDEGILKGSFGALHFKRCTDGYAIYDTAFPGSGFVCTPTCANIGYPNYINGVPVTEIHNSIKLKPDDCKYPIVIEGRNIKRVYLSIGRRTEQDSTRKGNGLEKLFMAFFDSADNALAKSKLLRISVHFCNEENAVDLCEISCDEKCILEAIKSKKLEVIAPSVILSGKAYESLSYMKVSGRIYPYVYTDWDGEAENTDYFKNTERLLFVEGSLCGNVCWNFCGCKALERIHLANGIQKIPPYAFAGRSSLTDLYIPDTVSHIGEYAFAECTKLARIHLPSDIKKIPAGLFRNCRSLEKCFLSDSIEEIEDEAFTGCTALRKPWIPKGIKRIANTAFDNPSWAKTFY